MYNQRVKELTKKKKKMFPLKRLYGPLSIPINKALFFYKKNKEPKNLNHPQKSDTSVPPLLTIQTPSLTSYQLPSSNSGFGRVLAKGTQMEGTVNIMHMLTTQGIITNNILEVVRTHSKGKVIITSPERKLGITDANIETSRIKSSEIFYDAADALNSDIINSFLFFLCLLYGFSIWWVYIPDEVCLIPEVSLNPGAVHHLRDTFVDGVCSIKEPGDACSCDNLIHSKIAQEVHQIQTDSFDPLALNNPKAKMFTIWLVAFIAASAMTAIVLNGVYDQL